MGIDIVMHTMTKYIGGHSDLIGGVLISKDDEFMKKSWFRETGSEVYWDLWKHGLQSAVCVPWM